MAIEEPAFTLVSQDGAFSIRDYAPMVVAEVSVTGDQGQAVNQGFRILAGYIYGGNHGARRIEMTAPVAQIPDAGAWIVRFTMPRATTLATLPTPNDQRIHLVALPAQRRAVLRFSGWMTQRLFAEKSAALRAIAQARHLHTDTTITLAQYNPPWTPWFLRRNEVMVGVLP